MQNVSADELASFYKAYGVAPERYTQALRGEAVPDEAIAAEIAPCFVEAEGAAPRADADEQPIAALHGAQNAGAPALYVDYGDQAHDPAFIGRLRQLRKPRSTPRLPGRAPRRRHCGASSRGRGPGRL